MRIAHLGLAGGLLLAGFLATGTCVAADSAATIPTTNGLIAVNAPDENGVSAYLGIPFGAPPVGENRWREPQPVANWDGVKKMDTFGDVCIQPHGRGRLNVQRGLSLPQCLDQGQGR